MICLAALGYKRDTMNPILISVMLVVAIAAFLYQVRVRLLLLLKLQKDNRLDHLGERIKRTVLYALVQIRMFRRPLAGMAHLFIFAAFLTTQINTAVYMIRGFVADFAMPLPDVLIGPYNFLKDMFWVLCLVGIAYWLVVRAVVKPWRIRTMAHQGKAYLILGFIASLAFSEFFMQGAELAMNGAPEFMLSLPASSVFGIWLHGLSHDTLHAIVLAGYWTHIAVVLTFLNFLPSGKHFHVIFAIPNIFTSRMKYRGFVEPPNLETTEKFGIATVADFSWKQAVDTYSCTECGRCLEYCPTALTDKPLTHRGLNLDIKEAILKHGPDLLKLAAKPAEGTKAPEFPELVGGEGSAISPETVWACTTCGSCELECPVFIDQVPRIIQLRQNLVLMRGEFPAELNRTFKGMEQHSNPWGMNSDDRDKWATGLDIPRAADIAGAGKEIPLLYWIGCAGSFDDRVKKITLAMVKILREAKIDFCILGKEEGCTGDSARRLGNEYLFQTLATTNIETLKNYKVKKILTHCPHCLQTLKHDYKPLGGSDYEVVHHTQFLAELIESGKVTPRQHNDTAVVFHDSCYLTRYNGISEEPRKVLRSIPSLRVVEFDNKGDRGVCCGAGGGRFWMEEHTGKRINHHRLEDGLKKNPNTVGSGCPFCLTMLGDGIKDKGLEEKVNAKDVAELVAASLVTPT
ncbi:MAG: (Fe-S)-binding protein [Deltaproteobacteria bacterium]|nr:(Fe-S)-binding protein [Deltaproteobacteria bacterium]